MLTSTKKDIVRRCRFTPYRRGCGPTFNLTVWDTGRSGFGGKYVLGYKLVMRNDRGPVGDLPFPANWSNLHNVVTLFEGEDFGCSPLHAIDSDATVASIMTFLTLRPGDTDREYFADYTAEQLEYCQQHAESLSCEVLSRFGEV